VTAHPNVEDVGVRLPAAVQIREVGPRDGLQIEKPLGPAERAALVLSLVDAGIVRIEAVSFVSPSAVPAMAHAAEVVSLLHLPGVVTVAALVPNVRGAEMALAAAIGELTVTVSVSETYNQRNVHMTTEQSVNEVTAICDLASSAGIPVDAVVSCSFGSPYEGDISPGEVGILCERLRSAGASAVTLADTTGMATPRVLSDVLAVTGSDVGLHLHDTRGTALVNLYAALQAGVVRFDTAIGGLGGSPFAHGAGGNVATEDVVSLLDDLGVVTGIDLIKLISISAQVEELVGHLVPSRVAHAGPRLPATGAALRSEPES
jgi:hydroxymethylglutaryl-CoA lyase